MESPDICLIMPVKDDLATAMDSRSRQMKALGWPALSLLYLATSLKINGFASRIIDQVGDMYSKEEVLSRIRQYNPEAIGVSLSLLSHDNAWSIISSAKETNPNLTVILGGIQASINDVEYLRSSDKVDVVVRGEGESTLPEVMKALEKKRNFSKVRGISFREKNGRIIRNPDKKPMNINEIPFPDRTLLGKRGLRRQLCVGGMIFADSRFTTILSSRGCPYQCNFCSTGGPFYKFRVRSTENLLDEMEEIMSLGYENLVFVDDNFLCTEKRTREICLGMKKRMLEFRWACEARVTTKMETYLQMVQAGCESITFGLESGQDKVLRYLNKKQTTSQIKTGIWKAFKAGVRLLGGFFIIGTPIETPEDIVFTMNFATHLPLDYAVFTPLKVFPKTKLWFEMVEKGVISRDEWHHEIPLSARYGSVPYRRVQELGRRGTRKFFFYRLKHRPKRLLLYLENWIKYDKHKIQNLKTFLTYLQVQKEPPPLLFG